MRARGRTTTLGEVDTPAAHRTITAADVMQPVPTTVEPEAHLAAAAYLMRQAGASALVVLRDERTRTPVGIVTDTDVAHAVADGRSVEETRVRDVLQDELITVRPDVPVVEAAERMVRAGVRHLPVADEGGLLGMLDISTACRALLDTSSGR